MSVSGNEETGLKPLVLRRSSCDYPAGIPIKKRRYPMIGPPSPPPVEEQSSSPVDSCSLQKDQSSPSLGSTLPYSSVVASSSGLSEAVKSAEPEERRESSCVEGKNDVSKVKVEEPTVLQMGSLDNVGDEEKTVVATNPVSQIVPEKNELNLAAIESLAVKGGVHKHAEQSVEVKVEAQTSELEEKTVPLLIAKENFHPVLSSLNSGKIDRNQDPSQPISLNLSLSKGNNSGSQCKTDVADVLNVGSSRLCADRANWDLNTPMDKWVGPSSDTALGRQIDAADHTRGVKPLAASVGVAPDKLGITERKNLTTLPILSNLSGLQSEGSLHLRLSPCLQFNSSNQSTPMLKLSSDKAVPHVKLPRVVGASSNSNKVNIGAVKVEPVEERIKLDARGGPETSIALLIVSGTAVKRELLDQSSLEALKSLQCLTQKSVESQPVKLGVDPQPVKPEPVVESDQQNIDPKQGKPFHLNEHIVQGSDKQKSTTGASQIACSDAISSFSTEYEHSHAALVSKTSEMTNSSGSSLSTENELRPAAATCKLTETACPIVNSSESMKFSRRGDLLSNSGRLSFTERSSLEVNCQAGESKRQVASDTSAALKNIDGKLDVAKTEDSTTTNSPEVHGSKLPNDLSVPSRGNVVGSASDEEKVNISADIEVSYSTDYESDSNHDMDTSVDMEIDSQEDYEDGEVRESLEQIAAKESVCEKGPSEDGNDNGLNTGTRVSPEAIEGASLNSSYVEVCDVKSSTAETGKDGNETSNTVHGENCEKAETSNTVHGENCEKGSDRIPYLHESTVENSQLGGSLVNDTNKAMVRSPLDQSGNRGPEEYRERETLPTFSYGMGLDVNRDPRVPKNDVSLVKSITDVNSAAKDIDNGSHRSRIINLPRSAGSSSPGRTTTFSGRLLPARAGRERLSDLSLDGDKIHSQGRDDMYIDSTQKYSRERHHDQRNSRYNNYTRGRGRVSNRLDNLRGDRESDREFASDYYIGPTEYRFPRRKFAPSVSDADLEYNSYNSGQDVGFVSSGRGGRKPLNDRGPFVRRMPAKRRSPTGAAHGTTHVVRRISRNISPNRCVVEDGPELVRPRRNVRGFADDNIEPMFSHPQPPYEAADGHFPNRNFPSVQRRVMRRIRSKSPVGSSLMRSPGVWSPPGRRSPDGFAGISGTSHQRSPPPYYRMERMKSPDRRCFPGEVLVRRQDMRDVDSGRDHGHPGSAMANNRSPSSRIVMRERRFGGVDPQERPESDNFYAGPPMNSGRLHELSGRGGVGDANGDERRFGERRGPVRQYRTSFNGGGDSGESFHLNSEDGSSRQLRYCPDDNTEFQERNNLVERDYNRRMKNGPPRRMRNMEDQEANYQHGNNQVWHSNEFDVKRKRY